jgi:hypothetical protein
MDNTLESNDGKQPTRNSSPTNQAKNNKPQKTLGIIDSRGRYIIGDRVCKPLLLSFGCVAFGNGTDESVSSSSSTWRFTSIGSAGSGAEFSGDLLPLFLGAIVADGCVGVGVVDASDFPGRGVGACLI